MPKAILVSLQLPGTDADEVDASLAELQRLVETLGFEVIGKLTQKRAKPEPATVVGVGKLREIARWTGGSGKASTPVKPKTKAAVKMLAEKPKPEEHDEDGGDTGSEPTGKADKVIFDQELTPNQIKHLEIATDAEVLDRSGVIVEIFHRHAKTKEARLQVEIARLKYLAPRIRAVGAGERQGGGIGSKGIGETAHELDRRRIRDRVSELQAELENIREDQTNRRLRRKEQLRVALIGYTNAGKSSLMRAMTGSEVLVADKLFATLDTTVRAMLPDAFPKILVSDTVGFIRKLPHDLVASFRSTLDEAGDASLLLYVVDASDPEFRAQLETTRKVIAEIDASDIPSKLIFNKVDRLNIAEKHLLNREFPEAIFMSALNKKDVTALKQTIRDFLEQDLKEAELVIPFQKQKGIIGEIRKYAAVLKETYDEDGAHLKVRTYPELLTRLKKMIASKGSK